MGLNFSDPTAVNLAASTPVERLDRPPVSILAGGSHDQSYHGRLGPSGRAFVCDPAGESNLGLRA